MIRDYLKAAIFAVSCLLGSLAHADINLSVRVTDMNNLPVNGAKVIADFQGYLKKHQVTVTEATNADGIAIITGCSKAGPVNTTINITVNGEGYYYSTVEAISGKNLKHDVHVMLRKRVNPAALYVKRVSIGVPIDEGWVAFDFEKGDLVKPYGEGKVSDLFLKTKSVRTEDNGSIPIDSDAGKLLIKFPSEHDGIIFQDAGYNIKSDMVMPHEAPADGYQGIYTREEAAYFDANRRKDCGVFMRVRSVSNEKGELKTANYAKLNEDLRFDPRESGWHVNDEGKPKTFGNVSFTYYFNPTPDDRNLEFDPERNLFKDLKADQRVYKP